MDCNSISELLTAYLDEEVTSKEREQIQLHLSACPQCRIELEALATAQKGIRHMLKEMAAQATPPAESWEQIKQRAGIKDKFEQLAPKRPFPAWITVPLSIFLLVILVGGLFAGMGGMALPPPEPPSLVSDGNGGAFVFWNETPHNYGTGLYANHVDAEGNYLWGVEGKQIATGDVSPPEAISDGSGGTIVAWGDNNGLYVWRLDSVGNPVWTWEEAYPELGLQGMTGDGSGGAILLRQDRNEQVYVQRISAEGMSLWEEGGTDIGRIQYAYMGMPIVSDGSGGAVVIWEDPNREGVFAQRVSQDGELLWAGDGVPITSRTGETERPQLINDGTGNFIITWTEHSFEEGFRETVYVQKLSADGNRLWGEQGILIHDSTEMQSDPHLTADGSGGCIVVWRETQHLDFKVTEVLAQRMSTAGEMLWQGDGVPVSDITQNSPSPDLGLVYVIGDGAGGGTVIWVADKYTGKQHERQVYAQKLNSDGQRLWSEGEIEIYKNPPFRTIGYSSVISDGNGGFVIGSRVSEGTNMSRTDSVYMQRIDSEGNRPWGESGVEIQMKHSSPLLPIIAAVAILFTILVLYGVFRGNRLARILTAIVPVLIGIAALFGNLLLIGPFGYSYSWAYILNTPSNLISVAVIPIAGLAIGAVGIWKRTVTRWITIPMVVFCALVTLIVEFIIISSFF
jgi:hypothetical protein